MRRGATTCCGTLVAATLAFCAGAFADEVSYRFEGDVLPFPDAGFLWGGCEPPCQESLDGGHFVLTWPTGGDAVNYHHLITRADGTPPPSLWVEWRLRSDEPYGGFSYGCDAAFVVKYKYMLDLVYMLGDTVVSFSGDHARTGLAIGDFRTYRFESLDGHRYCFYVDGRLFYCDNDAGPQGLDFIQMHGEGGCNPALDPTINEWDYVRYGTIEFGERIVASDPPGGFVDLRHESAPERFAITYDVPNYAYIEDITVEVTGPGTKPVVTATWRRDQDGPESLEVVLDRPIPADATTRFIFNDGQATNVVRYTTKLGDTDGDGDTDLTEVAAFQNCFARPTPDPICGALELKDNAVVDLPDLPHLIHSLLTGP